MVAAQGRTARWRGRVVKKKSNFHDLNVIFFFARQLHPAQPQISAFRKVQQVRILSKKLLPKTKLYEFLFSRAARSVIINASIEGGSYLVAKSKSSGGFYVWGGVFVTRNLKNVFNLPTQELCFHLTKNAKILKTTGRVGHRLLGRTIPWGGVLGRG